MKRLEQNLVSFFYHLLLIFKMPNSYHTWSNVPDIFIMFTEWEDQNGREDDVDVKVGISCKPILSMQCKILCSKMEILSVENVMERIAGLHNYISTNLLDLQVLLVYNFSISIIKIVYLVFFLKQVYFNKMNETNVTFYKII